MSKNSPQKIQKTISQKLQKQQLKQQKNTKTFPQDNVKLTSQQHKNKKTTTSTHNAKDRTDFNIQNKYSSKFTVSDPPSGSPG